MPYKFYTYKLKSKDRRIRQGDIFKNLPQQSVDFLIQSKPKIKRNLNNESPTILNKVIQEKKPIIAESIIIPSWGILASQDCDIRPNFDLLFYPMINTKTSHDWDTIDEFIKKAITDTTRKYYLPKFKPPNEPEYGPYQVIFQNPFIIPYNIINQNYSKCWVARIIEPAHRVFIGKLTHFYSRTPIDEFIFLENKEITRYITNYWKKEVWKNKFKTEILQKAINKITEIKNVLIFLGRKCDLSKIYFFNNKLIEIIQDLLIDLYFGNRQHPEIIEILGLCEDLLTINLKNASKKFQTILETAFLNEDSILNKCELHERKEEFNEIIKKLKSGEVIPDIPENFPIDDKNKIMGLGFKAEKALQNLKQYRNLIPKYIELCTILDIDPKE